MKALFGGRLASAGVTSTAAAILLVIAAAAAVNFDGSSYARNVSLDANMDVFWTIDTDLETIRVAVHAKAAPGWAGFGVSEMGGMEGADIVFFEASTDNITDAHSVESGPPVTDECTQDWTLVSAEADADSLVFEAERALHTGDAQDHAFVDDSADGALATRILTAWGDQATVSYHAADFAKGQVVLYGGTENPKLNPIVKVMSNPAVSSFDVRMHDFPIPATRTWYEYNCLSASDLPALDEYHAIGFEAIVNSDNAKHVHHLVVRAYTVDHCGDQCGGDDDDSTTSTTPTTSTTSTTSTSSTSPCRDGNYANIFVWAPGSSNTVFPDDVGFPLGNASGRFLSLEIDVHYNNPDEVEGLIDDSGVRVYYTEELRPVNMGVIQLGDPFVMLGGETLPEGKSAHSFQCPSACFEENFQDDEVTIFSHGLHMHETGQRLETRQYRNNSDGEEFMVHSAEVEYYSFLQAGFHIVTNNDSETIQKGDRFETSCYYDTDLSSVDSDNVTFGLGSENEMCIDFVLYYPDQDIPYSGSCGFNLCGGTMDDTEVFAADSDFERTFGTVDTCSTEDSNSSSSSTAPGLAPLAYAVTSAIALACVSLIVDFCT